MRRFYLMLQLSCGAAANALPALSAEHLDSGEAGLAECPLPRWSSGGFARAANVAFPPFVSALLALLRQAHRSD